MVGVATPGFAYMTPRQLVRQWHADAKTSTGELEVAMSRVRAYYSVGGNLIADHIGPVDAQP